MGTHTTKEQQEAVQKMLESLSPTEVPAIGIEALRRWWKSRGADLETTFTMHGDFGRFFVTVVGETKNRPVDTHSWKEPFLYDQAEPWMSEVVEFWFSLVRAGFAFPLLNSDPKTGGYPGRMRVTKAGAKFLAAKGDDLVLPDAIDRLRQRCPDLPEQVLVHFADAKTCLDHALGRPAVVLMGLAYETAIEAAIADLKLEAGSQKPAKRIERALEWISELPKNEVTYLADSAWRFADVLRRRRNDGSHSQPTYDFSDVYEFHELFVSALRNLPGLWSVTRLQKRGAE